MRPLALEVVRMPDSSMGQKCWTGYACSSDVAIDGQAYAFVVVAMNKAVAAAVCEHVTGQDMEYGLCRRVFIRPEAYSAPTLDVAAEDLYRAQSGVAPSWDQLGEATRSVWRERVLLGGQAPESLPSFDSGPEQVAPSSARRRTRSLF